MSISARTTAALAALLASFTLCGCGAADGESAEPTAEGAQIEVAKPETAALVVSTERSYTDPSRPADAREKEDIALICTAMANCARSRCSDDDHARAVQGTGPKSPWGKLMMEHLAGADQHRACRRLVKLLRADNLGGLSPDCAYLMRHCG
ncbi:MAG: hypothetical protein JNM72_19725 [Deltaproteobacteria bacterium]|jgi:hypothetical protein|nr:hypothetical protein [Deltaproteobacteria bacterium]